MPEFDKVQDSGERQEFATGSVRDTATGKGRFDLISPVALRRLARHYENGAQKYGDRNWEKGQPLSRYIDSAIRHLYDFLEGSRDEDHLAAAAWNALAAIHTETMVERGLLPADLNDLPDSYLVQKPTPPTHVDITCLGDEYKKTLPPKSAPAVPPSPPPLRRICQFCYYAIVHITKEPCCTCYDDPGRPAWKPAERGPARPDTEPPPARPGYTECDGYSHCAYCKFENVSGTLPPCNTCMHVLRGHGDAWKPKDTSEPEPAPPPPRPRDCKTCLHKDKGGCEEPCEHCIHAPGLPSWEPKNVQTN